MPEKKYKWHKLVDLESDIDWSNENIGPAEWDGKKICLARFRGRFFGFAYQCPHAGALLTEGWLDSQGNVVCPMHGYKFNIENGRNSSGEGYNMKHWPVEKREDGIYIGVEEKGFFSWPK
jgi:3-phenylpropionate/trans-cinnamate dioxygenase ferredoxin subunit